MLEMHELSESNDLQMDVTPGNSDLPQVAVGSGTGSHRRSTPAAAATAGGGRPKGGGGGPANGEQLSGAGYRVSAALEEANKMFLRTPRTREAALDGGLQMPYEKTLFDLLAFIQELFSLMVVSRLTEELSCNEIIDRE